MPNAVAASQRRRVLIGLLALIVALAGIAAIASAAQPGSYKGKSISGKRPVVFKLSGGKVRGFNGGINIYCPGDFASGTFGEYKFDAVIPPRAIAVRNGRFNYVGKDRTGTNKIEIHGRFVSRTKAKGWIQFGGGGCAGKTDFWATRRSS